MSFKFNGKKTGLFAAGVLFGTAGLMMQRSFIQTVQQQFFVQRSV